MRASVLRLGVLLTVLAGCGDENRTPTHFTPSNDKVGTSKNDSTPLLAPAVVGLVAPPKQPAPPPATATLSLASLDTVSLRGTGRLAGSGRMTSVSVALAQGKMGITYEGAIRQGACARMGAAVASLNPISADTLGLGVASTDVPVPIDSLLAGRHVVVYGKGGRPEVCGEIGSPPPSPPNRTTVVPPPPDTARADTAAAG